MAFSFSEPSMSDADWPTYTAFIREDFRALAQCDAGLFSVSGDYTFQITTTGTTTLARYEAASGNGTTSARKSYLRCRSLESAPQDWFAGMVGDKNFSVRNNTRATLPLVIDSGSENIGLGAAPLAGAFASYSLQVFAGSILLDNNKALGAKNGSGGTFSYNLIRGDASDRIVVGDFSGSIGNEFRVHTDGSTSPAFAVLTNSSVVAGKQAAQATTATTGDLYIPSCAGTPTGVPGAVTGKIPLRYDATNSILYAYANGAWRVH